MAASASAETVIGLVFGISKTAVTPPSTAARQYRQQYHDPPAPASDSEEDQVGKMKELMADEWDRAYAEGYRKGYLTALRWAFEAAFETLQSEHQTSEKQGKP